MVEKKLILNSEGSQGEGGGLFVVTFLVSHCDPRQHCVVSAPELLLDFGAGY